MKCVIFCSYALIQIGSGCFIYSGSWVSCGYFCGQSCTKRSGHQQKRTLWTHLRFLYNFNIYFFFGGWRSLQNMNLELLQQGVKLRSSLLCQTEFLIVRRHFALKGHFHKDMNSFDMECVFNTANAINLNKINHNKNFAFVFQFSF